MKITLFPLFLIGSLNTFGSATEHSLLRKLNDVCVTDKDCSGEQYCAAGQCLEFATCNVDVDCFNPSNSYFVGASCMGYTDCLEGRCSKICGEEQCKDGTDFFNCNVSPCSVDKCEDAVSCVDNYCGGCNAFHFDAAGNQVCNKINGGISVDIIQEDIPKTCKSDADCSSSVDAIERDFSTEGSYCAQGVCKDYTTCATDLDCLNPANSFMTSDCLGYVECQEGRCGMVCDETGDQCKDGSDFVTCAVSPCAASKCRAGVSCVDNYCGECNAIHFDAAGNEACAENTFTGTVVGTTNEDTTAETPKDEQSEISDINDAMSETSGAPVIFGDEEGDETSDAGYAMTISTSVLGSFLGSALLLDLWG